MYAVKRPFSIITFITLLVMASTAAASGSHGHDHDNNSRSHESTEGHDDSHGDEKHEHSKQMGDMFMVEKEVDGYMVSFMVMPAKPGKNMGGSHDFMVKIKRDGQILNNVVMKTKVKHPNGQSETKKAMVMGDWLVAGYDLGHKGKHQLMILFKTADGEKHKAGIYYAG